MVKADKWNDNAAEDGRWQVIKDKFYETPLAEMAPDSSAVLQNFSANLQKLAACIEKIVPQEK